MRHKQDVQKKLEDAQILVENLESQLRSMPRITQADKQGLMHVLGSLKQNLEGAASKVDLEHETFRGV